MDRVVEKWLTIAALTGWIGSMGSMMVLAVSAPHVNPIAQATQRFATRNTEGLSVYNRAKLTKIDASALAEPKFFNDVEIRPTQLSLDPITRHWLDQSDPRSAKRE
jgi:hypothetical protein